MLISKKVGGTIVCTEIRQEIINAALEIKKYGLIALSGGNVSVRLNDGSILVTPSGMSYESMEPEDILRVHPNGKVIEGELRPSVDTVALLYIYEHMPRVNSIIHTHQPYATAVGIIGDEFPVACTTLANVTLGAIPVAPYSAAASEWMGRETVNHIGDKRAVILKHHGVVTVGETLKEALYAAIYMEEAAKCYLAAKAAGNVALMTPEQVAEAVETFKDYGQKK